MKVLVCGGRHYRDRTKVFVELSALSMVEAVIEGGASGADTHARDWARRSGVEVITEYADWKALGPAAGPIRNAQMLKQHRPDLVLAFPTPGAENKGTKDMIARARAAGFDVRVIT